MAVSKGVGTKIKQGSTYIGTLTNIPSPEITADTFETTVLDVSDGYKTFKQNLKDGGEIALVGYYDSEDSGQPLLKTSLDAGTEDTYTIEFPSSIGTTWTFTGIVTNFKTGEANLEDAVGFEVTLKVTGKPNLGTTDSGGLTNLSLTGTAGTLSPTFDNAKYAYSWTFTTSSTITVTPTAASHTIKLYIDDVYVETVTSGAASSAIAFSAAQAKKIDLIAYEDGKNPLTYTVVAVRTS